MHYNGSNSFLHVNGVKMDQFKATNSEMKSYSLCLVTFQKILHLITWIKTGSNRNIYGFSVSYNTIEVSNIVDIHKRT